MYLSRVALDTRRRETMRALSEPQLLHGAIESSLSGERERNLWRIDWLHDICYLLLTSRRNPDLSSLVLQFGFSASPPMWETKDYTPLLNRIHDDQVWQFRLRANPVHSITDSKRERSRGRIHAHVTWAQQKAWLLQRAERHGFALEEEGFDVVHTQWLRFRKQEGSVTFRTAVFEGQLRVTDSEAFRESLTRGIGRAKAYGCGLLTVARPGTPNG